MFILLVPGPPNKVGLEAVGSTRLKVNWTPPREAISPVLMMNMGSRANELRTAYYDLDLRATDGKVGV